MTLSYIVSGFAVGILVGLTGVGGGSLMTPLLTLMFGINPTVAVGTDLAFASVTKVAGTFAHRYRGTVHWQIVKHLSIGALPAAVMSIFALRYFGALDKELGQIIRYSIAGSVLLTVIAIIFRSKTLAWIKARPERQLQGTALVAATITAGAVLGILVTISSGNCWQCFYWAPCLALPSVRSRRGQYRRRSCEFCWQPHSPVSPSSWFFNTKLQDELTRIKD
jgi:uncharacterized membrane protein YfcA